MDMSREDYFQGGLIPHHLGLSMLMANMSPEQSERLNKQLERDIQAEVGVLNAVISAHASGDAESSECVERLVKRELHKHVEHLEVPNLLPKR